jgi:hypothetical protein
VKQSSDITHECIASRYFGLLLYFSIQYQFNSQEVWVPKNQILLVFNDITIKMSSTVKSYAHLRRPKKQNGNQIKCQFEFKNPNQLDFVALVILSLITFQI